MTAKKRGSDESGSTSPEPQPAIQPIEAAPTDEFHSFVVRLATDPATLGAFIKDPDATMRAANISDVDQLVLKSGQPWAIHARLSGQKFTSTPPSPAAPVTVLVVDMTKSPSTGQAAGVETPTVRAQSAFPIPSSERSAAMFPSLPQILQILPQVHPQIFPQVHPQILPQILPQLVIHPQVFPQVHPQIFPQVHPQILPQIHPQIFPQVHPQIFPQILPQLVIHPQVFPQVHPQIFPQVHPQILPQIHPQIFPQVHPQIFPQIHPQILPQLVIHPQVFPQVHPQIFPQIHPQIFPQVFPVIWGSPG